MNNVQHWFNWKKVLSLLFILICLVVLSYFIYIYVHIEKSKIVDQDQTEQLVYEHTNVVVIDEMYQFQGEDSYHIVIGRDKKDEQSFIFIPVSKSPTADDLQIYSSDAFLKPEQIEKNWIKD